MEPAIARPSDKWIPRSIVLFFVFFVLLLSGFAWIAIHTYTGEVTANAYKKGLAYNDIIAKADAQDRLGWKSTLDVKSQGRKADVAFTLADKSGKPLDRAEVVVRFARPTQAGHDVQLTLRCEDGKTYRGQAELAWEGAWDVLVSADYDGHNYQYMRSIVIP